MKQYKNIKEVEEKYTFDLEDILKGQTIDDLFNEFIELSKIALKTKDTKYENVENYIKSVELGKDMGVLSNRIHNYLSNHSNQNLVDSKWTDLSTKWENITNKISEEMGSEAVRFFKNIEKLKIWKDDPRLKNERRGIIDAIEEYEHKLSDEVEEYLNQSSSANPDYESIFNIISDSELDYGFATDSKGKKYKLSPAIKAKFMKKDDFKIRKSTHDSFLKAHMKHKDSMANLLYQHFKGLTVTAKIRKYKNTIDMLTHSDKVDDSMLQFLFDKVSTLKHTIKNRNKYYKKFYEAKFKEKYHAKYDSYRELVKVKSTYTVEQMQNIVSEALKPFGSEYHKMITKAINERWVDYMTVDNKLSGAYSIGNTYGLDKKYILMNFDGELGSVETLAHELGHSMHSYFSDKNNDISNASYPIILAEIASIFNELMLYNYLLKTSKNDLFKFKILDNMIDGFVGTVFRQILWANYEYDLYNAIEKDQASPSYTSLSKIYHKNSMKYATKKIKYKKEKNIMSVYVPHYYYGFYVYKYAIGQLVANYFYTRVKNEGEKYLQVYINDFLSAGDRDYPLETLKKVGADLKDPQFYEIGFSYFKEIVKEWIKLGKKIFKVK
ncbi:oligoendopeptidase F [Mycoplasmopsis fermentans]|uniref:oligoendopeptidase F n=1 Tax=Mycoplasmopsis fermentans TaxID=2115 RepID=UPI0001E32F8D|nr:oligoendopeptidase F [Mycoplasmopsis fermentans]ADN68745.1 oligoendopeptidase F [Mycoplasmopsis fermentans JER]RMX36291.1 oligoendopeptidase F [Mycoplasmopsis fermentans MF-I2]RMX36369.1 oligoendopeptidase F [Mycoplasmopsis fermentans MF-I1]